MKPGFATTEFYMALTVVILGAAASVFAESEVAQLGGQIAAALAAAGYGFTRASAKKSEAEAQASIQREAAWKAQNDQDNSTKVEVARIGGSK